MNSVTNRAFMAKKKMYKKPATEVMNLETERLMDQIVVSPGNSNGGTPPPVQAPHRISDNIIE